MIGSEQSTDVFHRKHRINTRLLEYIELVVMYSSKHIIMQNHTEQKQHSVGFYLATRNRIPHERVAVDATCKISTMNR